MTDPRSTLARGHISNPTIKRDDIGRAYIEAKLTLTWVDDLDTLLKQSMVPLAVTFCTKAELVPLFPPEPPE